MGAFAKYDVLANFAGFESQRSYGTRLVTKS